MIGAPRRTNDLTSDIMDDDGAIMMFSNGGATARTIDMSTLIFHIEGPHGGVSLESFITIMENALKVLRDLDARLSETHREELTWYVSDIRMGSLEVGLEARARKNVIDVKHM